jgi:two-component system chemotaxis response regulator CheY
MKILIVEDDFISRTKLQKILSFYGECHTAVNGEEAIQAFKLAHEMEDPYALITLDIRLPDLNGQDIIQQVREWEKAHQIPEQDRECVILMVTAMEDSKNILSSFKGGCEGYIVKPFDKAKIEKELNKLGLQF